MYFRNIYITTMMVMLVLAFNSSFGREVKKTGTTAGKFLSIGIGPRANAMGGAFSSIADDASAMYWNPGGLAFQSQSQAFFTYTELFADINVNYFGLTIPTGAWGTFGVSVTALTMGEMLVTTERFPDGTGEKFDAGSYAFGLSYGRSITENFAVGFTVKYVREDIFNSSASGIAFDIGTIFNTPFYGIKFASSITNYGSKMKMEGEDLLIRYDADPDAGGNNGNVDANYATDRFDLPLRLQVGISRDFTFMNSNRLTLAVDANHPNDNAQYVNVGGELGLLDDLVSLRGGYKALFLQDSEEGLTLGAGLNYGGLGFLGISVDYAFQQYKHLGDTHSFGILLKF